jgi:hypothetical protein
VCVSVYDVPKKNYSWSIDRFFECCSTEVAIEELLTYWDLSLTSPSTVDGNFWVPLLFSCCCSSLILELVL